MLHNITGNTNSLQSAPAVQSLHYKQHCEKRLKFRPKNCSKTCDKSSDTLQLHKSRLGF